jgi:hypothetical protein
VTAADDLAILPPDIARDARVRSNGEVEWPRRTAGRAVDALAAAGFFVLGTDLRKYDLAGAPSEAA